MLRISNKKTVLILGLSIIFCSFTLKAQDLQTAINLTESEQFESAKTAFENLLKTNSQNGDVYYYYGEYHLKKHFTDTASVSVKDVSEQATANFKNGIQNDPTNPLNYVGLGKIALLFNDAINAKMNFDKAVSLLPSRTNKTSKVTPERQSLTYMRIAEAYIRAESKDTIMVFPLMKKIEDNENKNPEYFLILGDAYLFLLNDGSNAILNYKKAQELDAKSAKAKMRLGQLWVRAKKYTDALGFYKEAIKADSTFAPAYRELAELYYLAGQYDNAKNNYKKYLDLSPGNLYAKVRYASFLFLAKDYNEAINEINEVLEKDQSYTYLYRLLAYSYFESNSQFDKGLNAIEKFYKETKSDKLIPSDYKYYGLLLAKNKKDSMAVIYYKKAIEMDSTFYDLYTNIAISYLKQKKYNESINAFNKKISLHKAGIGDYLNLGTTYYTVKQYGKADTALDYVIKNKPDLLQGWLWKARTNSSIDSTSKEGRAKPFYEKVVEIAKVDSVKNSKEILESYDYFSYYYFKSKDYCGAKKYYEKILAIEPKNEKATNGIAILKRSVPNLRCEEKQ
ncbi:MAG: tetratricopeptide repeat protein [Bacteroidales bacterium]|jgi:tetratricopeptide (TPR) repeat protein